VATLVQLRLLQHHTTPEGHSTYQADTSNAYNILRVGRVVELVDRKLGPAAAEIMASLAAMGFATIRQLQADVVGDEDEETSIDTNRFRVLLKQLITQGYIKAVRQVHFRSPHDPIRPPIDPTDKKKKPPGEMELKIGLEVKKLEEHQLSAYDVLQELDRKPSQVTGPVILTWLYADHFRRTRCSPSIARILSSIHATTE
jgi:hypothetical protein